MKPGEETTLFCGVYVLSGLRRLGTLYSDLRSQVGRLKVPVWCPHHERIMYL